MKKTFFVNKKSVGSKLFKDMKAANPEHKIVEIATNTRVADPEYNLIDISPKKRGLFKHKAIGLLNRNSQWKVDYNGRSTDFLPSNMLGYGCEHACSYCYVDRRDPVTFPKVYDDAMQFVNFVQNTMDNIATHRSKFIEINKKDLERHRDKNHPNFVTFDIGCDSDATLDNQLTRHDNYVGHIIDIMNQVSNIPEAMTSFATKSSDIDAFIKDVKNPSHCRIRLSMMPEHHRVILEMNTSKIVDRITAINKLVSAGFDVHINLSPIVITNKFKEEYSDLLSLINDGLSDEAKKQMAYEIIFLTHDMKLNEKIEQYAPKAKTMMCDGPLELEPKWNKPTVFSYSRKDKNILKSIVKNLVDKYTPYSRIRYMF